MAFRTPIAQFVAIDFMSNGEVLNAANLQDRMLHKLDDKCEWLKDNLTTEITKSSRIANRLGEDYDSVDLLPCWTVHNYYDSMATYKVAIESLDQNLSRIDAEASNLVVRQDNNDIYLGEDSNTPGLPVWLTPFSFAQSANHHAAIQGLDNKVEVHNSDIAASEASIVQLDSQMLVRVIEITALQSSTGSLQTLTSTHTSQIAVAQADIVALEANDAVQDSNITILESQMVTVFPVTPGTHASRISQLESQVTVLEGNIATLNGAYKTQLLSILDLLDTGATGNGPFSLPTV